MPQNELEKIITRAMNDEKFREQLMADPKKACAEYKVTDEEIQSLLEKFDARSEELTARVSKRKLTSKFGGFSGPMGIEDAVD